MSKDILNILSDSPQDIFKLYNKHNEENFDYFNNLIKKFLDPISKEYSVLDEIYVDGLDSTQVFGQTKIVVDGVGESLLLNAIPELNQKYGNSQDSSPESNEDVSEDEEEEEGLEIDESEASDEGESELETNEGANEEEENDDAALKGELEEEFEDEEEIENFDEEAEASNDENKYEDVEVKKDVHGLNDEFFDIDEFNKQTLALEDGGSLAQAEDEEEIDFFRDLSDDGEDEENQMEYFDDFYQKPGKALKQKKQNHVDIEEDGNEEEENEKLDEKQYEEAVGSAMLDLFADEEDEQPKDSKNLSSFEKQQQEIQAEISKLEAELVADKKWTMKGEISSKDRPQDSLLDDPESRNLEFDRTAKPVPVITTEVTETLEDLIKRRIKAEEFDELPKRIITDVSRFHNKQKFELSEEKSSKSLADLYENDYNKVDTQEEANEELKKQHDEITELFTMVTHKLDSLCSAHFIPKPHQFKSIEIKVSDNAASINLEDAQPLHVSSESTLAPQEVYKIGDDKPTAHGSEGRSEVLLKSGLSYSKDELSREDKQRLRRANKRKKSKQFNQRKEIQKQAETQGTSNPNKKQKVGEVINTLSRAKNLTVIGKKGEMRDVKGNIKKAQEAKGSSSFKL